MERANKLLVWDVPHSEVIAGIAGLRTPPEFPASRIVVAGVHTVRYEYVTGIRFGSALYRATIAGPSGQGISDTLKNRLVLAPHSPYQAEHGLYAFVEWHGDLTGRGASAISIVDLALGQVIATHKMAAIEFIGCRVAPSIDFIIQEYSAFRHCEWYTCDALTGKRKLLFAGGFEGHISSDGRHLFVLSTRADVFVALISLESGILLDLKKASDFEAYARTIHGLDTVSFDPELSRLTSMVNWTRTDYRTGQIEFEKLITIGVGRETTAG